jgi:polysaccharide pyruvyl transferase WcaK-like protein
MLPAFGLMAAAAGRTVVLHGVGIDRGLPAITAAALRRLARRAAQVTVRDAESAAILRAWGVEASLVPDLSVALAPGKPATAVALLRAARVDPRRQIVGLSLTAVNAGLTTAVLEAVSSTMEALPEVQFAFVPMSQHPFAARHNDRLLARRLQARQPRLRIVEGWSHPADVLAVFGQLDVVVGMRFHSLLFANRMEIPAVPIAYADKVVAWLAAHGEVPTQPTAAALLGRIRPALARREAS